MTWHVLDASVGMRWIMPGVLPPLALRVRELLESGNLQPVVPALWHWEMATGLVATARRQGIAAGDWREAWAELEKFSFMVVTEPGPAGPVRDTAQIARGSGLSVYHATYLELALRRNVPLATLDMDLRRAAQQSGVVVDF